MTYWDTSCVVKLYARESDSEHWQAQALASPSTLVSSALLRAELAFALHAKEGRGHLVRGGAASLLRLFETDIASGRLQLFPVGSDVLAQAVDLARWCTRTAHTLPLRTLDAIHLATAIRLRCPRIASCDKRMRRAALRLGITPL